jgi:hypothetical protein
MSPSRFCGDSTANWLDNKSNRQQAFDPPFGLNNSCCNGPLKLSDQSLCGIENDSVKAWSGNWCNAAFEFSITGRKLRWPARGGFIVNIRWQVGALVTTRIRPLCGRSCRLVYGERKIQFQTRAGEWYALRGSLQTM